MKLKMLQPFQLFLFEDTIYVKAQEQGLGYFCEAIAYRLPDAQSYVSSSAVYTLSKWFDSELEVTPILNC